MIKLINLMQSDFNKIIFNMKGDAVANTCEFNISKAPFNIDFRSNPPAEYVINFDDEDLGTASAHTSLNANGDNILSISFSQTPDELNMTVYCTPIFNSIPWA